MNSSFKATPIQVNKIIEFYSDCQESIDSNTYFFKAKNEDISVIIYENMTVLFQGKKAHEELKMWEEIFKTNKNSDELLLPNEEEIVDHIGSDEVGCGDYFGPVVVTSAYVKEKDYDFLKELGVKDSKKISDDKIRKIAPLIKEKIPTVTFVLNNEKYNELTKNNFNTNKVKAYIHNFVLYELVNKYKFNGKIVVDKFCSEFLYYDYLKEYSKIIQRGISFLEKAESKYLAVACASIVARERFLLEIEKIKNDTGYNILLGANKQVDELAKTILKEKGFDYLSKITKVHFKNTKKILEFD